LSCHSGTRHFFLIKSSMILGLVLMHCNPRGALILVSGPTVVIGTSKDCNVAPGPCSAIAELGIFSHKIFDGFWTYVVALQSQRCPHTSVGADTSNWHLQGLQCCTRTLFCHSRTGYFFLIKSSMVFGLVLMYCNPRGALILVSGPTLVTSTSKDCNIAPGPCSAIAELGTFFS
jgi:hypothetical protein